MNRRGDWSFVLAVLCAALSATRSQQQSFVQFRYYSTSPCSSNPTVYRYTQLNTCIERVDGKSERYTSVTQSTNSDSKTTFSLSSYASFDCTGMAISVVAAPWSTDAVCAATGSADPNLLYFTVVMVPYAGAPSATSGLFEYSSLGGCLSTMPVAVTYAVYDMTAVTCAPGDALYAVNRPSCGSFTSSSGGFLLKTSYSTNTCYGPPLSITFYQVGVCYPRGNNKLSQKYATSVSGSKVAFALCQYPTANCTGIATVNLEKSVDTTMSCGRIDASNTYMSVSFVNTISTSTGAGYFSALYFASMDACSGRESRSLAWGTVSPNSCTRVGGTTAKYSSTSCPFDISSTAVAVGFLQVTSYSASPCTGAPTGRQYIHLNTCVQKTEGSGRAQMYVGVTNGDGKSVFILNEYTSSDCSAAPDTSSPYALDTSSVCVQYNPSNQFADSFQTVQLVSTIPSVPGDPAAVVQYTSLASCRMTTPLGIAAASVATPICSSAGGLHTITPQCSGVTSSTGGFVDVSIYSVRSADTSTQPSPSHSSNHLLNHHCPPARNLSHDVIHDVICRHHRAWVVPPRATATRSTSAFLFPAEARRNTRRRPHRRVRPRSSGTCSTPLAIAREGTPRCPFLTRRTHAK